MNVLFIFTESIIKQRFILSWSVKNGSECKSNSDKEPIQNAYVKNICAP